MSKKRKIKFFDLVFMNVAASFGIRWIAKSTAASFGLGLGAIPMWIIFSIIYYIPQALIVAEFASRYESDGGISEWVKQSFGEKWGFMVAWFNWIAKVFWYSAYLTFLSIDIAYMLGITWLAENKVYVLILSLATLWIFSYISTKGAAKVKFLTNLGALGSMIPTVALLLLAFLSVCVFKTAPSASTYSVGNLIPTADMNSLVAISALMCGLSGTEITANFVNEMDNPKRDFPKAILISAIITAFLYVAGSLAMTMVLSPEEIQVSTGMFDVLLKASASLGISSWLTQILSLGIAMSVFAGLVLYTDSSVKMLFGNSPKHLFSEKFTKTNSVHIPEKAVYFQAALITVLILASELFSSVNTIYEILVSMTALSAILPYLLMYMSYVRMKMRNPVVPGAYAMTNNVNFARAIGVFVTILAALGILLTLAPAMDTVKENVIYEIEMIGGCGIVVIAGLLLWRRYDLKYLKGEKT